MSALPRPRFRVGRPFSAAAALTLSVALAGCGVELRAETPPPTTPAPDAAETTRELLVDGALGLETLAAACPDAEGAERIATDAAAHATALGGVWTPFPSESPTTDEPPSAAGSVPVDADTCAESLQSALATAADDAWAAALAADGDQVLLYGSIAISRQADLKPLAASLKEDYSATPAPFAADAPPVASDVDALAEIVRDEDSLGYAGEFVAARSADSDREAIAADAAAHRKLAEAIAVANDMVASGSDPRTDAYELPVSTFDSAALQELLDTMRAPMAAPYGALFASVAKEDREAALSAWLYHELQARSLGVKAQPFPGMAAD